MKQKLLRIAYALTLIASGSGLVYFSLEDGEPVQIQRPLDFGNFEVGDPNLCTRNVCNATLCQQAQNLLRDGGVTDVIMRAIECDVRLGKRARNQAADAGAEPPAAKYVRVRFFGMERNGNVAILINDAGYPAHGVQFLPYPCAKKPADLAVCGVVNPDGGLPLAANTGDTIPAGQWTGAGCVRTPCSVIDGDPE